MKNHEITSISPVPILVFSFLIFRTHFFNTENPDSIVLNAFTYFIIASICNQSPVTAATPLNICRDHLLTLLELSDPPLGHCHFQILIPCGHPPRLAQALTYLSATIAAPLHCAGALLTSPGLQSPRLGYCCCWSPARLPPSPHPGSETLHWATLSRYAERELLQPSQALTLCWDTPWSISLLPHPSWVLASQVGTCSLDPAQAPTTLQGHRPTEWLPVPTQAPTPHGRLPFPWGASDTRLGSSPLYWTAPGRHAPYSAQAPDPTLGFASHLPPKDTWLKTQPQLSTFALNYLGREQKEKLFDNFFRKRILTFHLKMSMTFFPSWKVLAYLSELSPQETRVFWHACLFSKIIPFSLLSHGLIQAAGFHNLPR